MLVSQEGMFFLECFVCWAGNPWFWGQICFFGVFMYYLLYTFYFVYTIIYMSIQGLNEPQTVGKQFQPSQQVIICTKNSWTFYIDLRKLTWNPKITKLKRKLIFQTSIVWFHINLVGAFNPFEIYQSNWVHLPQIGMNMKNIWNHHLVINHWTKAWDDPPSGCFRK